MPVNTEDEQGVARCNIWFRQVIVHAAC